jgi:hypothetical protein
MGMLDGLEPRKKGMLDGLEPRKPNIADPRNGLSKSQIAEAEANKKSYHKTDDALATVLPISGSDAVAFGKGFTHTFDEYGASINKGLDKISKTILPKEYQTTFFEDNAKYWNDNRKMNEIETEDNKIAHLAGEVILDPMNVAPVGLINKGRKAVRVGGSMVAGAGMGYGMSKAKNYGNTSLTDEQKASEDALSTGIVSALNGIIAGVTKGRVTNVGKLVDDIGGARDVTPEEALDAFINNPEAHGVSAEEGIQISEELSKVIKPTETPPMKVPPQEKVTETIFNHPRATEAIDMARDRYASQTYNDRAGGGSASWMENGEYRRAGAKGETNYHQGFELSKADIKKIDNGKITPEIEEKLRLDIDRLENDPNWNINTGIDTNLEKEMAFKKAEQEMLDANNGVSMFANVGHNLAGGFGAGTVNAGSGMFDEGDTADKMADRFIQGLVAGVAGVNGLKVLRKTNPKAFEKVRSWVMDNNVKVGDKLPTEGVQLGVFAGKKAKGFEGKKTHVGKYDGQTRFEIDDSTMSVHNDGVIELSRKGYTPLEKLIKHDELFDNYPQLRNVVVKFDKNMESHATFDGEGTITLSNKFKNKDEMSSSIMHEIQHWVQNKEGFAGGGNFDDMMMQVEGKIYNLEKKGELSELDAMNYKNDLDYLKDNRSAEAFDKYKKIAGEIEAREVQARKNLTPEERELIPNYENADTMVTGHSDEAYNSAFMAKLDGRHGDFDSTGIHADDATLDFSRNKSDNTVPNKIDDGRNDYGHVDELASEKANRDWADISKTGDGVQNFKNALKSWFTDTMSAKYHTAREGLHVAKNKSDAQISNMVRVLETIDKDTRVTLHRYLTKQDDGATLPPKVKQLGDMVRKTVTDAGHELVRRGQLDAKDMKEWGDAYLARLYEPTYKQGFGLGSAGNKTLDKTFERGVSREFKGGDLQGMKGWLNENGFLNDDELLKFTNAKQMEDFLKSEQRAGLLREGKLSITKTASGKIKFRRDYTKAERESMGEIEDAMVTIPETMARLAKLKQHADFLEEVAKVDGAVMSSKMVKNFSPQEIKDAGYKKLPTDARYGALSGKTVRFDVADDIGVMHKDINQLSEWAEQKWKGYHGIWKKSKTVWNPTAHVNNTVGNWALMHMAGVDTREMPKILNRGRKQIQALKKLEDLEFKELAGALSTSEKSALVQLRKESQFALEAKEIGIFGKSQLNDILAGLEEGAKTSLLGKIDKWASGLYQLEDNFNRLSFYLSLRHSGRDSKTSKQMVDFMLPDYSKPLPKGWRFARDSSIAPFISWSYYTMPSIVKALGSRSGAKGFGKISRGQKSVAKVVGLLSLMEYALSKGEITPLDNLPFYEGNKPEDFKGRRFVIGKDGDNYDTLKVDRMLPYAELKNPLNYTKSQVSGILPNLLYTLNGHKMYDGRPITYKNKSSGDKALDWMKYLTKQYAPLPMPMMNGIDAVDATVRSKESRKRNDTIQPRSSPQELLKNIGINTMTFNSRGLKRDQKKN